MQLCYTRITTVIAETQSYGLAVHIYSPAMYLGTLQQESEQYLGALAEGAGEPGGYGDRKGLKGGTGGPGRVLGGGENGAGLYSLLRAPAGPAAVGGDHPAYPPIHEIMRCPASETHLSPICTCPKGLWC